MKKIALVCALIMLASSAFAGNAEMKDFLQGTWDVVHMSVDGETVPVIDWVVVFTNRKYSAYFDGNRSYELSYRIDHDLEGYFVQTTWRGQLQGERFEKLNDDTFVFHLMDYVNGVMQYWDVTFRRR